MASAVIRFDMRAPGLDPVEAQPMYQASVEMSRWADERGFDLIVVSEHHDSEDGFLPSPLVLAGALAGCTTRIMISIAALLVPLHDPLRLAEDIAVVDLLSAGRLSIVAGLGYRPIEYEMFGLDWKKRGRRFDECLDVLLKAWTGEPFEYRGRTVRVRPRPFRQPHPFLMVGGSGRKAAERAARFGLGFFPAIADEVLAETYRQACRDLGNKPGMVMGPSEGQPGTVVISEDPDRTWDRIGSYLLRDATTYFAWQRDEIRSAVKSAATTIDELRAEGVYQILTPDECVELAGALGPLGAITLHPMCGGIPPEVGWESVELFTEAVLPRMRN